MIEKIFQEKVSGVLERHRYLLIVKRPCSHLNPSGGIPQPHLLEFYITTRLV